MMLRSLPLLLCAGLAMAAAQEKSLFSTATTAPPAAAAPKPAGPRPIDVVADGGGTFTLTNGLVTYKDNVRVNDPQLFLHCQSLRLMLDLKSIREPRPPAAKGTNTVTQSTNPSPPGTNAPPLLSPMGGLIREAAADGGVILSNKLDGSYALGQRARYYATNDTFELEGDAFMVKRLSPDNAITNAAPRILFHRASGTFIMEGKATTGGNLPSPGSRTNAPAPAPKRP